MEPLDFEEIGKRVKTPKTPDLPHIETEVDDKSARFYIRSLTRSIMIYIFDTDYTYKNIITTTTEIAGIFLGYVSMNWIISCLPKIISTTRKQSHR